MIYQSVSQWYKHYNLLIFDEIDSTSAEARRLIEADVDGEFVIWAKSQTSGKGKVGRYWHSPQGNLYLSMLLKPMIEAQYASQLSYVVALAVGDAIKSFISVDDQVKYKWPNDIFLNGKKCAGILLESGTKVNNNILDFLIIGIGINVSEYPPNINPNYDATSLQAENIVCELHTLLDQVMKNFLYWISVWRKDGFNKIGHKWLENSMEFGKVITVSIGQDRVSGIFDKLTDNGCIRLILAGGQECFVSSGEVLYGALDYCV
ncbi:Bifunctional protein BirA [Rickettsiales bacterium Ac37b]|nr:Bifunctional protein BirA [Rickettsiales bacterium Ac37b]